MVREKYRATGTDGSYLTAPHPTDHRRTEPARDLPDRLGGTASWHEAMVDPDGRNGDGGTGLVDFPARPIYRALLVRGLEPSEAANLTAYLAGLPSRNLRWTIPEVEAILRRRATIASRAEPDADDRPEPQQLTWLTS